MATWLLRTIVAVNIAALVGAAVWLILQPGPEPIVASIALTGTLIASLREFVPSDQRGVTRSERICLLGFLGSGKTTYLAVLLTEAFGWTQEGMTLSPRDDDTIRKLHHLRRRLEHALSGRAAPTGPNRSSVYRCVLSKKRLGGVLEYELEFVDLSGDEYDPLSKMSNDEASLDRHPDLAYLVDCRAIFLTIDLGAYVRDQRCAVDISHAFMSALGWLGELSAPRGRSNLMPAIGLLFLKADLLAAAGISEDAVLRDKHFSLLRRFVAQRSSRAAAFFVSSLGAGASDYDQTRSAVLDSHQQSGVLAPLTWVVSDL